MKNQWRLYLGLFFTFMMIVFAILNNQTVSISFGFTTFSGPLILVVFGSVFIGALIVSLMVTGSYWRQNKEIKQLGRWIGTQQKNYKKRENIMKEDEIYNE